MASTSEALREIAGQLSQGSPDVTAAEVLRGELTCIVRAEGIVRVLTTLRDDPRFQFTQLIDLCGADYPEREHRFDVVYHMLSMKKNLRIRLKVQVGEETTVPTACNVFPTANWFEREVWDMYGVFFSDHPDLRRILTDYGFEGHPQRKDFPLTGYVEVRYDEDQKRVIYEPVKLAQDFRTFDFLSPWEGLPRVLPGDEKATSTVAPPPTKQGGA
jgi:NADH-quinone oxidoreductase subunit C